jgi:hypothetical protein
MKYIGLKEKLLNDLDSLNKDDFYLLEGKLIFIKLQKAQLVKEYLSQKLPTIEIKMQTPRNWQHWRQKYESVLFFKNLPKGLEI